MLYAPNDWLYDIDQPSSKIECLIGIGGFVFKSNEWCPTTTYRDHHGDLQHLGTKWLSGTSLVDVKINHLDGDSIFWNPNDSDLWTPNVNEIGVNPDAILKSYPKFTESVDIVSKIFRTQSITLEVSNVENHGMTFSDWAVENQIIGSKVLIYYITQSCFREQDVFLTQTKCVNNHATNPDVRGSGMLMSALDVVEFTHTTNKVKIKLEDATQEKLTQIVPNNSSIEEGGHLIPSSKQYQQQFRGKLSPIVYGYIPRGKPIVDSEWHLRIDRWWDETLNLGGVGIDDYNLVPNTYEEGSTEFLHSYDSGTQNYAIIPMIGGPQYNDEDDADEDAITDMQGALQYRFDDTVEFPAFQLYAGHRYLADNAVEDGLLTANQHNMLVNGTYQSISRLETNAIEQRTDTYTWENVFDYWEQPFGTPVNQYYAVYSRTAHGEVDTFQYALKDHHQSEPLVNYDEFYENGRIFWDDTLKLSTTSNQHSVIVDIFDDGTEELVAMPAQIERNVYSVVIPLSGSGGINNEDFISKLSMNLIIKSISNINWVENLTNTNWISPSNLVQFDANNVGVVEDFPSNTEHGGWLLVISAKPINPNDYSDFYWRNGGAESGEYFLNLNAATYYLNLNALHPLFEESALYDPEYEAVMNDLVNNYTEWINQEYVGTFNELIELNFMTKDYGALELKIAPCHWFNGWCYDSDSFVDGTDGDDIGFGWDSFKFYEPQSFEAEINLEIANINFEKVGLTENVHSSDLYMPLYGRKFVNGNLIQSPTKIISDIFMTEILKDPSVYDRFIDANTYVLSESLYGNYNLAVMLDSPRKGKELIADISKDTPIIPNFNSLGKLKFNYIKNTYDYSDVDLNKCKLTKEDIVDITFTRTPLSSVILKCSVLYRYDYGRKKYIRKTDPRNVADLLDGDYVSYYGIENDDAYTINYETKYINDGLTAVGLRDRMLMWNCNQHNILNIKLRKNKLFLEVGDIVTIADIEAMGNVKPYGEDITYQGVIDNGRTIVRNGQEIYPFFMIYDVRKTNTKVDVKCIQLHNLDPTQVPLDYGGCMDQDAYNYNPNALVDDGSCLYFIDGCTDPSAINFDPTASFDDGTCEYASGVAGCTDPNAVNYNPCAITDDGSCTYDSATDYGSTDLFIDDNVHIVNPNNNNYSSELKDHGLGIPIYPFYDHDNTQSINLESLDFLMEIYQGGADLTNVSHYVMDGDWSGSIDESDIIALTEYTNLLEYTSPEGVYDYVLSNALGHRPDFYYTFSDRGNLWLSNAGLADMPLEQIYSRDFDTNTTPLRRMAQLWHGPNNENNDHWSVGDTEHWEYLTMRCSIPYKITLSFKNWATNGWEPITTSSQKIIMYELDNIYNGQYSSYDNALHDQVHFNATTWINQEYDDYTIFKLRVDVKKMYQMRDTNYVHEFSASESDYFGAGIDAENSAILRMRLEFIDTNGNNLHKYIDYVYAAWLFIPWHMFLERYCYYMSSDTWCQDEDWDDPNIGPGHGEIGTKWGMENENNPGPQGET